MAPTSSAIFSRIIRWCAFAATAAVAGVTGCTALLGDFELASVDGGRTGPAVCASKEYRCRDDLLVMCNTARDGWDVVAACRTKELCNPKLGRCDTCTLGDYRCEGDSLQTCGASLAQWDTACTERGRCNLNTRSCRACEPGDVQCRGAVIEKCNDAQAWEPRETCATAELCESQTRKEAQCLKPACDVPGKHLCDGKRLFRCAMGRDRTFLVEECRSEALCDSALANADNEAKRPAHCKAATCEPEQWSCDGATLRQCNPQGTGYASMTACMSPELCNPKTKSCTSCTKGEYYCAGAVLLQCRDRGAWMTHRLCASAALCKPALGQCDLPTCSSAGNATCDGNNDLFVCTARLTTEKVKPTCATAALCNALAARCDPPVCKAGAVRCGPENRLQQCDSTALAWVNAEKEACSAELPCNLPAGSCAVCRVGEARCNDLDLEICTPQGWERKDHCATPELCDPTDSTACQTPKCRVGEFKCEGQILSRCNDARTQFDKNFRTCIAPATR